MNAQGSRFIHASLARPREAPSVVLCQIPSAPGRHALRPLLPSPTVSYAVRAWKIANYVKRLLGNTVVEISVASEAKTQEGEDLGAGARLSLSRWVTNSSLIRRNSPLTYATTDGDV